MKQSNSIYYAAESIGGSTAPDYVTMTDPETQASVKVPKELEAFIGHVASSNRRGGKKSANEAMEKIQDELEISKAELKELRDKLKAGGDGSKQVENLKAEYDKMLQEKDKHIETLQKDAQTWRGQFEEKVVMTDLMEAMGKSTHEFYNFQQSMELLRLQGKAQPKEIINLTTGQGTGMFETILTLTLPDASGVERPVELKPAEAIEKFFSLDVNKFHIKNKLNPGAGTMGSNYTGDINNLDQKYQEAMKQRDLTTAISIKQAQYEKSKEKR